MPRRIEAIILAAGSSRRYGAANKLLQTLGNRPLVNHVVTAARRADVDGITLVVGHDADAVIDVVEGASVVHNAEHASGMASSLAAGIAALAPAVDAALVLLADMPWLESDHLNRVVQRYRQLPDDAIVTPVFSGTRGHPVLWPRAYFPELLSLQGDRGARELLRLHADRVRTVAVDDDAVLRDVDTPSDLALRPGP